MANQRNEKITIFIVGKRKDIEFLTEGILVLALGTGYKFEIIETSADPKENALAESATRSALQICCLPDHMRSLRAYIYQAQVGGKHSYVVRELGRQSTRNQVNPGINSLSDIKIDTILNGVVVSKRTAGGKNYLLIVDIGLSANFFVPHPKNEGFHTIELNTEFKLRVKQVDVASNVLELELLP